MTRTISKISKRHTEIMTGMFDLCKSAVEQGAKISINPIDSSKPQDWDTIYEFIIDWQDQTDSQSLMTESPIRDPDEDKIEITNIVLSSSEEFVSNKPIKPKNRY